MKRKKPRKIIYIDKGRYRVLKILYSAPVHQSFLKSMAIQYITLDRMIDMELVSRLLDVWSITQLGIDCMNDREKIDGA